MVTESSVPATQVQLVITSDMKILFSYLNGNKI